MFLDLDALCSRYQGEALIQRLVFIASHSDPETVQSISPRLKELLRTASNTFRYRELFGNDPFLNNAEATNRQAREVLQARLASAQSHLHKDAIRSAYQQLAEHELAVGNLQDALHNVLRAKDYCINRQQTATVCLSIVELSIYLKNYASVRDYVTKLEHTIDATMPQVTANVKVASGLEALHAGRFRLAAKDFQAALELKAEWNLLHRQEIALYAAVLALATFDRHSMILLAEHPEALELVPDMRECLLQFGRRINYANSWERLQSALTVMQRDVFLAPHVDAILERIKSRAILQYWSAYQRVECAQMVQELGSTMVPSVDALIQHMIGLIDRGEVKDTRIDLQSKVFVRDPIDHDSGLKQITRAVLDDTYSLVIRLACQEFDISTGSASQSRGRGGRTSKRNVARHHQVESSSDSDGDEMMMDVSEDMNPEDLY